MNIKLTISYDGTNYSGWQVQPNAVSVQSQIESALKTLTGEDIKVVGSGRTDAGVHAQGQVASFTTTKENIPPEKYFKALNPLLPPDIKVIDSCLADDGFNARKSAKKKTYKYSLYISQVELPLKERFATRIDKTPDLAKMQDGAKVLTGEHDFKCMCSTGSGAKTTVRTVYGIDINLSGNELSISVTGNGFLYNMVRIMVGTLLDIGYGKLSVEEIEQGLKTGERKQCGKTLPAKGLCLIKVEY